MRGFRVVGRSGGRSRVVRLVGLVVVVLAGLLPVELAIDGSRAAAVDEDQFLIRLTDDALAAALVSGRMSFGGGPGTSSPMRLALNYGAERVTSGAIGPAGNLVLDLEAGEWWSRTESSVTGNSMFEGVDARISADGMTLVAAQGTGNDGGNQWNHVYTVDLDSPATEPELVPHPEQGWWFTGTNGASVSADGSRVAYLSPCFSEDPGNCSPWGESQVFVWERGGSGLTSGPHSVSSSGVLADRGIGEASISEDGASVVFVSDASNLDLVRLVADGEFAAEENDWSDRYFDGDIFVRDLDAGSTVAVSVVPDGGGWEPLATWEDEEHATWVGAPSISGDGRFVTFLQSVWTDEGWWASVAAWVHDRDVDEDGVFDEVGEVSTEVVPFGFDAGDFGVDGVQVGPPTISGNGRFISAVVEEEGEIPAVVIWDRISEEVVRRGDLSAESEIFKPVALSHDGSLAAFYEETAIAGAGDRNGGVDVYLLASSWWMKHLEKHLGPGRSTSYDVADPVNVTVGNLHHSTAAFSAPGHVYGVEWSTTSNSLDGTEGDLGVGMASSYGQRLYESDAGVKLRVDDGRVVTFVESGGGWARPEGFAGDLDDVSGEGEEVSGTVVFDSGEEWVFDDGWLVEMSDGRGQEVTVGWCSGRSPIR